MPTDKGAIRSHFTHDCTASWSLEGDHPTALCPNCNVEVVRRPRRPIGKGATDTSTVYIFKTWVSEPTYHDYGRIKQLDIARTGDVTKCGLLMYDGETHYRALLRRDHADLFAHPCRKCFADEVVV